MKRLISWLLALTMIMSLPLSAFAAGTDVEVGEGGSDVEVGFEELLPGYSADNRLTVAWTWNKTQTEAMAQVTVPAGKTMYFEYQGDPSFALFVNGEEYEFTAAQGRTDTNKFQITNSTDAEVTYELGLKQPVGSYNNPEKITELDYYTVNQAAGDNDGYCYTYTATETGTITFYFTEVPGTEDEYDENGEIIVAAKKYTCDISVTNMRNSSQKTLLVDGVDNFGLELTVNVNAGDELLINVAAVKDLEGNFYPEAIMTWYGRFDYPAGSDKNPIAIEWAWSDDGLTATATVNVPEGETQFFAGISGMDLTANGAAVAMSETGVFSLTTGEYALVLSTPVGTFENPEVIENIDGYTDSNSLGENEAYYYIWTATEDGTVTLNITDGANITVNNQNTYAQSTLAEVDYDENYKPSWSVAQNLTVEVKAGETLKIEVVGLLNFETYTTPAIDYTLTGSFEKAEQAPEYSVAVSGITLDMAAELFVSAKFLIPDELKADENATLTVEFKGDVTEYNLKSLIDELGLDSKKRLVLKQPIPSPYMDKKVNVTIKDGNGYTADFTYNGASYEESFSYGIKEYMDLAFAQGDNYKTTKEAIVALLTYGSYAQVYFKNNPNVSTEPAYNMLTEYGYSPIDISQFSTALISQETVSSGDLGVSFRTATPALDAAVYMTVQINNDAGLPLNDLSFALTYYDASVKKEVTIELEDVIVNAKGRFEFKIENIAAAMFDYMYKITVTGANGQTYTCQYSIMAYVKALVDAYEGNASKVNDLNLYKAMYYYNQAANALFE